MTKTEYGSNMLLITSYWGNSETMKLIPLVDECPYTEVIYDPTTTLLVVISKIQKENLQMVPRLDDDGNSIQSKKPKANGKPMKETRTRLNTLQEYYIIERSEQEAFLKMFAINHTTYNSKKFFDLGDKEPDALYKPEAMPLLDDKGVPLTKK